MAIRRRSSSPLRVGWRQGRSASGSCQSTSGPDAACPRCTTSHHKTHSTAAGDEVTVVYAWHPWAGRLVRLHEVIERATGASARCSLVDATNARLQESPVWMLDAVVCRTTRT